MNRSSPPPGADPAVRRPNGEDAMNAEGAAGEGGVRKEGMEGEAAPGAGESEGTPARAGAGSGEAAGRARNGGWLPSRRYRHRRPRR